MIATAIPVITSKFGSTEDVGWYGSSFMVALLVPPPPPPRNYLPLMFTPPWRINATCNLPGPLTPKTRCASQPLAGKTYVLFPKKTTYMSYLAVLEIGSLICALAPSSPVLIVGRAIAGLGASGIFAGGFAILTTVVPLHKRAIYTGTMSSTFAVASIVGPVLGGGLTQRLSWRWCFYINLPIGGLAAALFFPLFSIRRPCETEKQPLEDKLKCLDAMGFVLFAGSVAMLLFALQWGGRPEYPWSSATIIGLLVGSIVTMALFLGWQLRQGRRWDRGDDKFDSALIPPRLFTGHRNVALLCAGSFFVNGPFQIMIYWLPLWFQAILGVTPTQSAIYYFPTVISDVLAAVIGSAIVMKLGWWNPFLIFGNSMVCLGAGLLSTITPGISRGYWIGYQIFGGIGYSLVTNMASSPPDLSGHNTRCITKYLPCCIANKASNHYL